MQTSEQAHTTEGGDTQRCFTLSIGRSLHLAKSYATLGEALAAAKALRQGVAVFIYDCLGMAGAVGADGSVQTYGRTCRQRSTPEGGSVCIK